MRYSAKTDKKHRRRHWKTLLPLSMAACLGIGVTAALIYDLLEPKVNAFSLGEPTVEIEEDFDGWDHKKVSLKNQEGEDAVSGVARAMLVPVLKDKNTGAGLGEELGPIGQPTGTTIVLGDLTLHLAENWQDNWFYLDGYFYYRKVLKPGQTSEPLLEKVSLTHDTQELRRKYKDVQIEIEVMADILQADSGAPMEAWGVEVNGDTVAPL